MLFQEGTSEQRMQQTNQTGQFGPEDFFQLYAKSDP